MKLFQPLRPIAPLRRPTHQRPRPLATLSSRSAARDLLFTMYEAPRIPFTNDPVEALRTTFAIVSEGRGFSPAVKMPRGTLPLARPFRASLHEPQARSIRHRAFARARLGHSGSAEPRAAFSRDTTATISLIFSTCARAIRALPPVHPRPASAAARKILAARLLLFAAQCAHANAERFGLPHYSSPQNCPPPSSPPLRP